MPTEELDFNQVLEADLANIIKKAASGQPLTGREREMIIAEKAKQEKKDPIAEKKEGAAIAEASKKTGRAVHTGYLKDYGSYGEQYQASPRTVARWVKQGKTQTPEPIPCPLDDPCEMRTWWAQCMTQRCPAGIIDAEKKHLAEAPAERDPENPVEKLELEAVEVAPINLGDHQAGLAGAMERLEWMEIEFSKKASDPGQAKNWFDALSKMSSLAEKVRKEKQEQGLLVPKLEVAQIIQEFHGPIEQGVRGLFLKMCKETGFHASPVTEAAWGKICDDLFRDFGKGIFDEA